MQSLVVGLLEKDRFIHSLLQNARKGMNDAAHQHPSTTAMTITRSTNSHELTNELADLPPRDGDRLSRQS
jgi:hypothetical protein